MTKERRRLLVDKLVAQTAEKGTPIDGDAVFMGWVEEWIAGELDVPELRRRYAELIKARNNERRQKREVYIASLARRPLKVEVGTPTAELKFENSIDEALQGLHDGQNSGLADRE
jgi:hypothetical protein